MSTIAMPEGLAAAASSQGLSAVSRVVLDAKDDLLRIVTGIATRRSAEDEFARSLRVIAGVGWELRHRGGQRIGKVSTFLPSNNVLYSYTLFGIVPAIYSDRVAIRPSTRVSDTALALHEALLPGLRDAGLTIDMMAVSQRGFLRECADSKAVVFAGRPENAASVAARLGGDSRVLTFGSGPNPLVIGPEADLAVACRDAVEARVYNSGQDCLCPDVVFAHRSVAAEAAEQLAAELAAVPVGDRRDPSTAVAPLVYPDALEGAAEFLAAHRDRIVLGTAEPTADGLVRPTLVRLPWDPGFQPPELFSPIVVLMEYDDAADLRAWLCSDAESARGMYVSVYGEPELESQARVGTSVVCVERTTFDVEDGNRPFGGFGVEANAVHHRGTVTARPLLLSAEALR